MELNEFQKKAMSTCLPSSSNFSYMMLNLVGEVGEFASKVAKAIRSDEGFIKLNNLVICNDIAGDDILSIKFSQVCAEHDNEYDGHGENSPEAEAIFAEIKKKGEKMYNDNIIALKKEAGDIMWQIAGLCSVMGWSLEEICQMNLDKLQARKAAGTIDGSGDGITDRTK